MEKDKRSRRGHRSQMTKLIVKAGNITSTETPLEKDQLAVLEATLDNITERLEQLKVLDERILDEVDDDNFDEEYAAADDYRIEIYDQLVKFKKFLQEQSSPPSNQAGPPLGSSQVSLSSVSSQPSRKVNLPKLTLAPFSGDVLTWQSFRDGFDAAVHDDTSIDDVQKFQYLRAHLRGEAARKIQNLPLTRDHYHEALDLLTKSYGRPQKIISAYMKALWQLEKPTGTLNSMIIFHDNMESYIRGLNALGKSDDNFGDLLIPIILEKLPANIRRQISRDQGEEEWTLKGLREAIRREIEADRAGQPTEDLDIHTEHLPATAAFVTTTHQKPMRPAQCAFCKRSGHRPTECQVVTDKRRRLEIVKRDRLCYNCLGNHRVSDCKSKFKCQVCKRKHHTTICMVETPRQPATPREDVHTFVSSDTSQKSPVLLKTAVADVSAKGSRASEPATLLFDDGSQRTFITEPTARTIGINVDRCESEVINVSTLGAKSTGLRSLKVTDVTVIIPNNSNVSIRALIVPQITTPLRNYFQPSVSLARLPYLQGLELAHPVSDIHDFEISILVGADFYYSFVGDHIVRGKGPTAVSSKLGYLLSGPLLSQSANPCPASTVMHVATHTSNEDHLLQKFWDVESIGITDATNHGLETTYDSFTQTHLRQENGRYVSKLPWRQDHAPLPTNRDICEKRTRSMVRRLSPETRQVYNKLINDQLARGFIEPVSNDDVNSGHYLPHHPVKKNSETTPIRIVYDCSCKTANNPSLNDCLDTGPSLLNDLASILLRFRMHKFCVSADIEKAFLQVGLHESDRDFTKFMWPSDPRDPNSPFTVYRFKVVLFGAACSPFILNATVKFHLESDGSETATDLSRNIYVDNVLSGRDSETELVDYHTETVNLMKSSGFNLREWATNSAELKEIVAHANIACSDSIANVLGLRWDTDSDLLGYPNKVANHSTDNDPLVTKREVVSATASLYDPLGFITPVHINAKIFVQKLWKEKLHWDEPLSTDLRNEWVGIYRELQAATQVQIPRRILNSNTGDDAFELHVFSDASKKAYGAAVYLRHRTSAETALVMSKSKVTPVKSMTIPRAELMGALLGSRLVKFVHSSLSEQVRIEKCILWSDSQIVLHWLQGNKTLPCFVNNRVAEIKANEILNDYKYCPTTDNPADLLSRGISTSHLTNNALWWHGPQWLKHGDWPICEVFDSQVLHIADEISPPEVDKGTPQQPTTYVGIADIINASNYSTLSRLLRVSAYVLRFVHNVKVKKQDRHVDTLSAREINAAEKLWVHDVQNRAYPTEIRALTAKQNSAGQLTRQLRLFLDEEGFIRVGGRLHNAPISCEAKFPLLLPRTTYFTTLMVVAIHSRAKHSGSQTTTTLIRQRFWIPQIRPFVRSLLKKCVVCKLVCGKPYRKPIPAPLQSCRLREAPPFTTTGVDFTGAVYVSTGKSEQKAYICLFTCAVTRAIHLELVTDLTAETFLRAFRRFAARRSLPRKIMSDNGSTYLSASEEIGKLLRSDAVQNHFANCRVEWCFIPKRAPWFGGFWERLIGLTKTSLRKVLGRRFVSVDELQTVLTEIEATLNDPSLIFLQIPTIYHP